MTHDDSWRCSFMDRMPFLAVLFLIILSSEKVHAQTPLPPVVHQLDPFAPLPAGVIVGPAGPMLPSPPPTPKNSVVIPPLDAELVWSQMVDVVDDYFKVPLDFGNVSRARCNRFADLDPCDCCPTLLVGVLRL